MKKMSLRYYLVVSAHKPGVSNVHKAVNVLLLSQNEVHVCKMHSFDHLGRQNVIHVIKWARPSPSAFAYCKQSKTGWWEGLGTRLEY